MPRAKKWAVYKTNKARPNAPEGCLEVHVLAGVMLATEHKDKCRQGSSVAKRKRDKRDPAMRAVDRAETSSLVWLPCRATASRR